MSYSSRAAARSGKKTDPFYHTKQWEKIRLERLRLDDWKCQKCGTVCGGKKRKQPSPHVDHIVPRLEDKSKALDIDNLRTLCHSCHSKVTIASTHGRNKPEIGQDGYPI